MCWLSSHFHDRFNMPSLAAHRSAPHFQVANLPRPRVSCHDCLGLRMILWLVAIILFLFARQFLLEFP